MENSDDMMKAATELIDSKNRGGLVYPTSFTLQLTMLMETWAYITTHDSRQVASCPPN